MKKQHSMKSHSSFKEYEECPVCQRKANIQNAERISSHSLWYKGAWELDTCRCGNLMKVPNGKKGFYRCNTCADIAENMI